METIFLVLIILMLVLAVFDLIVGVSNDAVNFLTSAIGSEAGSFRTIMIIASLGVFVGASSSGGMMEIAKRGVFTPSLFTFENIIFIYVVVMLSDILLLDFFNSMKLPTSTTISIVFELLGAAIAVSFLRVYDLDQSISVWFSYLNSSKATEMVVAILVSVVIAFVMGWFLQYILRALVTYDYKRYMKLGGSLFGGISILVVTFFILNVGLKTSPLRTTAIVDFAFTQPYIFYLIVLAISIAVFYFFGAYKKVDTFRIITLIGTFALAMAFASNDLVNFIGVPIAGFEAFQFWRESGQPANEYLMEVYMGPAGETTSNPWFLILAGAIMVITLWTSKKARNVIQTTVSLSRQKEGAEKFSGNDMVRIVVRGVSGGALFVSRLLPRSIRNAIERRYNLRPPVIHHKNKEEPAFDMVRASVNLIVAAFLISLGTRLKLPLSTTYVSFMVLMGTSLADKAWNRDSAVYRVSGVFTVIAGWFVTAFAALFISIIFATIAYKLSFVGIGIIIVIVFLGIYLINRFTDNEVKLRIQIDIPDSWFEMPPEEIKIHLMDKTREVSEAYKNFVERLTEAIVKEDSRLIREIEKTVQKLIEKNNVYQTIFAQQLKELDVNELDSGKLLLDYYLQENELLMQVTRAVESSRLHVLNMHSPLFDDQIEHLQAFSGYIYEIISKIQENGPEAASEILSIRKKITKHVDHGLKEQVKGLIDNRYSHKNSQIVLSSLLRNLDASGILFSMYLLAKNKE